MSEHPLAFALRKLWAEEVTPEISLFRDLQELPGIGVRGQFNGQQFMFKSFAQNSQKYFGLFEMSHSDLNSPESRALWSFRLEPRLREGVGAALQDLNKRIKNVYLLSGDHHSEVTRFGEVLHIQKDHLLANLSPDDKRNFVKSHPYTLMIGDGINDGLALKEAWLGIAVSGSVDVALLSADAFLLKEDLSVLSELFSIAEKTQGQIRRNLGLALIYNTLGATLAVFGYVSPLLAAVLMPISSLVIFLSTWSRLR